MKKLLIYSFVFVVIAFGAGVFALKRVDLTPYKAKVIALVYEKTGRVMTIGNMKIQGILSISLAVNDVTLSNPTWSKTPSMLTIGQAEIAIDLLPLLVGKIRLKNISVVETALALDKNQNGQNNWTFPQASVPQKQVEAKKPKAKSSFDLGRISIGKLSFKNVDLSYDNQGTPYALTIESLSLVEKSDTITIDAQMMLQNEAVTLKGRLGSINTFFEKEMPYQIQLAVNILQTQANLSLTLTNHQDVKGSVDVKGKSILELAYFVGASVPDFKDFSFKAEFLGNKENLSIPSFDISLGQDDTVLITVAGQVERVKPLTNATAFVQINAPDIGQVSGLPKIGLAPMTLNTKVAGENGVYSVSDFILTAQQSQIKGSVTVETGNTLKASLKFNSPLIDLSTLFLEKRIQKSGINAARIGTPPPKSKKQLFSPNPLPFNMLRKMDANFDFDVKQFVSSDGLDLGAIKVSAALKDGVLTVPEVAVDSFFKASLFAKVYPNDKAQVVSEIKATKLPLSRFLFKQGVTQGNLDADISFSGVGGSVAEIFANSSGKILANLQKATLSNKSAKMALQGTTIPQDFRINCLVVNAPIKQGIITSQQQIALNTDLFLAQLNGTISLRNETLKLSVSLSADEASPYNSLSGVFQIGGTFVKPRIDINPDQVVDRVVGLASAFFSGGKKALKQQAFQKLSPKICQIALDGGAKVQEPSPEVKEITNDVKSLTNEAQGMFEGLFGAKSKKGKK